MVDGIEGVRYRRMVAGSQDGVMHRPVVGLDKWQLARQAF